MTKATPKTRVISLKSVSDHAKGEVIQKIEERPELYDTEHDKFSTNPYDMNKVYGSIDEELAGDGITMNDGMCSSFLWMIEGLSR